MAGKCQGSFGTWKMFLKKLNISTNNDVSLRLLYRNISRQLISLLWVNVNACFLACEGDILFGWFALFQKKAGF